MVKGGHVLLAAFAIGIILVAFTYSPADNKECSSDADCVVGGCSSEICGPAKFVKNVVTPCVFRAEYRCLRLTTCKCVKGKCQWVENQDYLDCMEDIR